MGETCFSGRTLLPPPIYKRLGRIIGNSVDPPGTRLKLNDKGEKISSSRLIQVLCVKWIEIIQNSQQIDDKNKYKGIS